MKGDDHGNEKRLYLSVQLLGSAGGCRDIGPYLSAGGYRHWGRLEAAGLLQGRFHHPPLSSAAVHALGAFSGTRNRTRLRDERALLAGWEQETRPL